MGKDFGNTRQRSDISVGVYGKVPPQDPELEKVILGAMLLETDKLDEVISMVKHPEAFYVDAHQMIFSAILELYHLEVKVDIMTVMGQLRKMMQLDLIGGAGYLTELTMNVVSSAHVEDHCKLMLEYYLKREAIRVAGQMLKGAYDDSVDAFDLVDMADSQLIQVLNDTVNNDPIQVGAISRSNIKSAIEKREKEITHDGPGIGLKKLEEVLICWQPADFVVIGARPSTGKTAFALQLAMNAATHAERPTGVGIFSLEMGGGSLVDRMHSNVSRVTLKNIKQPVTIDQGTFDRYILSDSKLSDMPIYIDDSGNATLTSLKAKIKKLVKKRGVRLVIIDYLQLVELDNAGSNMNREQEISKISRGLKQLAKVLDITIIALSQLNRTSTGRADNIPKTSDLRESGAIEQDADVIMLLYRPSDEEIKKNPDLEGILIVIIGKHRNGETRIGKDSIKLYFDKSTQYISDYGPTEQQQIHMPTASMPGENFRPLTKEEKMGVDKLDNDDLPF